ncbi:MAG: hypothetical protein WD055_03395 [Candidatus Dependentiae bacterium]
MTRKFFLFLCFSLYINAADVSVKSIKDIASLKEMALITLVKPLSTDELKFFFQNNVTVRHVADDLWRERLKGSDKRKEVYGLIQDDAHLMAIFIASNHLEPTVSMLTQVLREKKYKSAELLLSQNLDLFQEDIYGDRPCNYMSPELLLYQNIDLFQEDAFGNRPFYYLSFSQKLYYLNRYLFSFF